jgi:hypothetical protein
MVLTSFPTSSKSIMLAIPGSDPIRHSNRAFSHSLTLSKNTPEHQARIDLQTLSMIDLSHLPPLEPLSKTLTYSSTGIIRLLLYKSQRKMGLKTPIRVPPILLNQMCLPGLLKLSLNQIKL